MMRFGVAAAAVALLTLAGCGQAPVNGSRIERAAANEWLSYGRSYDEQRFSPLRKINTANVKDLGLAWFAEFDTNRGQEATPIMADGVLYTTTAWSKVYAFDARTGAALWNFDPQVAGTRGFSACCDVVNRGVAIWDGMVFVGTLDGRLIALDARTGAKKWEEITVDQSKPYTITMAPRVVRGNVLIGNSGGEYGVRGYLTAYDAKTGEKTWRFYMTPNPELAPDGEISDAALAQHANTTWDPKGAWTRSGGGGTPWDAIAYDPALNTVYVGVGNGSPWNQKLRSPAGGDNLFLSSILALDATTGAYKWHYQTTPGETWDYTATQHIMLADITIDGAPRKVLMQAPKNGFFYVLDRETGALISATPYIPMAPESQTPAGTPISWSTGEVKDGRPVENPSARYARGAALVSPAPFGGHNWQPMAFNADTGLVYIPVLTQGGLAQVYGDDPAFRYRDGGWNTGISFQLGDLPGDEAQRTALRAMLRGQLIAWDPVARKPAWTIDQPSFWNAGVLSTGGGLVFQGTAEGEFRAFDAAKGGEPLWRYETTNGIIAAPMTYAIGGEQYVAVMVGYGGAGALSAAAFLPSRPRLNGRLMVFKLGGAARAPAYDIPPPPPIDLAGLSSRGEVRAGLTAFNNNCLVCHGANASGGYLPDLRRSAMIRSPDSFKSVVLDGALAGNGMASFSRYLDAGQVENIRAYLITEARRQAALDAQKK